MTTPFEFLKEVDNDSILFAVMDEHPQTIAVIVSYLQPTQIAYIIEGLPPERQLSVIRRMTSMRRIEGAVLAILADEFQKQISNKEYVRLGGVDNIAEALTLVDPGTYKYIMENLGQDDPDLVDEIKYSMRVVQTIQRREKGGTI